MEMLAVVAVIGVTAALAAPAVHSARMEAKTNRAAIEIVRIHRNARAAALMYGRAHLVRYDSGGRGSFHAYRGIASNCNANGWGPIVGGPPCGSAGSYCIDRLDLMDVGWTIGSSTIRVSPQPPVASIDVCYEPSGRVQWRRGVAAGVGGGFSERNAIGGGMRYEVQRLDMGVAQGVTRIVAVPLGGEARLIQ